MKNFMVVLFHVVWYNLTKGGHQMEKIEINYEYHYYCTCGFRKPVKVLMEAQKCCRH